MISYNLIAYMLLVSVILLAGYFQVSFSRTVTSKYFQFSDQKEGTLTLATNYATIKSVGSVHSNRFTICSSIYIGFFRDWQTFFTLRSNGAEKLWLSLSLTSQDASGQAYTPKINYFDGSVLSTESAKLRLRPHAWSNACATVDVESGNVIIIINGVLTHNTTITSQQFKDNVPVVFKNNLILGAWQRKYSGAENVNGQSEASVTNVNVFSYIMNISQMVDVTREGLSCTTGDIVSWNDSKWDFSGSVQEVTSNDVCKPSYFTNLYKMGGGFRSWSECVSLCPRIHPEGRVPLSLTLNHSTELVQRFGHTASKDWFWAPFRYQSEGNFTDFYTEAPLALDMFSKGQPNGGTKQQCSDWQGSSQDGKLFDTGCVSSSLKIQCLCQTNNIPILRLRGLCEGSMIDTHYTLKSVEGSITYQGLTSTSIGFQRDSSTSIWTLNVNLIQINAFSLAEEETFILGKHLWSIESNSAGCDSGNKTKYLTMSGCREGEFTCSNGDCVKIEERCDQVLDCQDESDEVDCKTVVLKKSYRKTAPPVKTVRNNNVRKVTPASVKVSLTLLDISAIREAENEIDIKFSTELEWNETRATYYNLKMNRSLNTLETSDISLWIPKLIYRNNKDNDDTRSGLIKSNIMIVRKGSYTRSDLDTLDEIEIFKGEENPLIMIQSYTKQLKCNYNLQVFPFDTQVVYI